MITTNTGAKKLESGDNWREIFPNPGTGAAGAHNASVDAQDRIQAEVAPIINGKRCSVGAASGEYVLLRNSTITGKADGAYQAAKAIPANTDLDSTYLGSPITGGLVNELNSKITNVENVTNFFTNSTSYTPNLTMVKNGQVVTVAGSFDNFNEGNVLLGVITKNLPVGNRVYAPAIRNDTSALAGSIYLNTDGRLFFYGSSFNAQLTFSITYITG